MALPLPENIAIGDTGHAGFHNDVNGYVNALLYDAVAINSFLASPSSGSAGAAVFRVLTAADVTAILPNLVGNIMVTKASATITANASSGNATLAATSTGFPQITAADGTGAGRTEFVMSMDITGQKAIFTSIHQGVAYLPMELVASAVKLTIVGAGLWIKEGSNATMGVATLVAGTKVVSTNKVTANSRIMLTGQDANVTGNLYVSARSAGTSFTILSSNAGDTGTVGWIILEPS